ncbi:hypothetical protein PIROE2DRAFT_9691 [Piromyces sp. E2]|nr:hypothetical protein PIROE2DRAFT_9691 [Piromyces sp. E2]|eukprot:OUM63751.1 hypothetical protein PIROE2DRAFT_9691 [Piromyces sp. E2]
MEFLNNNSDIPDYIKNNAPIETFGYVIFNKNGTVIKKKHYIVQEYLSFRNGNCVEDNKFNYNYGESEIKTLSEIKRLLRKDLDIVNYIVGQGIKNDIRDLQKIDVDLSMFKEMNGTYETCGIIDTQDLFSGNFFEKPISLKRGLERFFIPYRNLHNAGNDAYYTMEYFLKLISKFNFNDNKNQKILKIKIPDDYNEEDYIHHMNLKKLRKKQEKELKKLNKNKRNNYRNHSSCYDNDDDDYDYGYDDDYSGGSYNIDLPGIDSDDYEIIFYTKILNYNE